MVEPKATRHAPGRELPAYAYIPGSSTPHPRATATGHSYAEPELRVEALDPERWQQSEPYRYGVDLLDAGFYWEAHEVFEALWHAAGRSGPMALLLKGLIKLAAAGVKIRQGLSGGVAKHARRAADHFRELARRVGGSTYAGLDLDAAAALADELGRRSADWSARPGDAVAIVFPRRLPLEAADGPAEDGAEACEPGRRP